MRAILPKAILELTAAGCETPKLDAEVLLAHALGCERHEVYTTTIGYQIPYGKFADYIERRNKREPVAYITGYKEFWSMNIKVTPDVLIPRPETEALVEKVLKVIEIKLMTHDSCLMTILDLGTGSGCIAAALAKEFPQAQLVVSDISEQALAIAKENLKFAQGRIQLIQSDLFEKITGKFDLIVSNPPYCASKDWENLQPEIKNYEPRLALDGGFDGLDFVRKIRQDAPRFLKAEGWLLLENGPSVEVWNALSLKGKKVYPAVSVSAAPRTLSCR